MAVLIGFISFIYIKPKSLFVYLDKRLMDSLPDNRTPTPGIIIIHNELYILTNFRSALN